MGGGEIQSGAWIHPQLIDFGLEDRIRAVLSGESSRLFLGFPVSSYLKDSPGSSTPAQRELGV